MPVKPVFVKLLAVRAKPLNSTPAADADVGPVLFSAEQIAARVQQIGGEIERDFAGSVPLVVAILKGSVLFVSDLLRAVDAPIEVEFLAVSSYGSGTKSTGVVRIGKDIDREISGRDVLIVEDIVDTGATLRHLKDYLGQLKPATIRTCSLLVRSPVGSEHEPPDVDYVGFEVASDAFVIGYGLDHDQRYRNLPYIAEFLV